MKCLSQPANDGCVCDQGAGAPVIQPVLRGAPIARTFDPEHHGRMAWTTPSYEEIEMDAEIGSYQQDGDDNVPIVHGPAEREQDATAAAE